ncbi:LLM class flavin-dependent oxidoreductase [Nostoc sp. 3335mG]|nr:LLM class flavin-dependent oxidoreductase [Nostoc sp. 3335mG]
MNASYRLSVLDQSPIAAGSTAAQALQNTLDLARLCDDLGYHRYWMAEHHATPALAGAAPEALIGPVSQVTKRMRIGSGGIMLPHYSPFKVAETFKMLAAMAPGRIDLGLGRAPGSDQRTALAMRQDRSRGFGAEDFPAALNELLAYLDDRTEEGAGLPPDHVFAPLRATLPSGGEGLPVWLLGSSPDSAVLAGRLGLPYAIADFINPDGVELAKLYRDMFVPSRHLDRPEVLATVWAIAADTEEEAQRLSAPAAMMFAHLVRGVLIPVPSVDEAIDWLASTPGALSSRRRRTITGTPGHVRAEIDKVAEAYRADEMMIVNIMPDHAARRRAYELVAAEYKLAAATASA